MSEGQVGSSSDSDEFFAGRRKHFTTCVGHDHHVFDTHAPLTGDVRSRLNRDHHAGLQQVRLPGSYAWGFVDLKSHSVASGMREVLPQTSLFQYNSCRPVHFADWNSGRHRVDGGQLGFPHGFIKTASLPTCPAHIQRSGHVRAVTSEYNTEVTDYEPVSRKRLPGCPAVRQSASLPPGNDGFERHAIRASEPGGMLHLGSHLEFPHPGPGMRQDHVG